jgi:ribosome maturation factor RimP
MSTNSIVTRVRSIVEPIAADLGVEVYDLEYAGGQLTVTLDTPPGSEGGITLDTLSLATRLLSRELDHADPIPGHYTLEVTSPGLERTLRTPEHFRREVGKPVAIRLRNVVNGERRLSGVLIASDETTATIALEGGAGERVVPLDQIDRARTVFVWGPAPKPGAKKGGARAKATTSPAPTPAESPAGDDAATTDDTEAPAP